MCCSNRRPKSERAKIQKLEQVLRGMGVIPVFGAQIYADEEVRPIGRERAEQLMRFYRDDARAVVIGRNLELSGNPHPF